MRAAGLIAALLTGALVGQGRAESDSVDRFATLDAALVLARVGQAEGNADMMIAALQVVADLGPSGATNWIENLRQEAIFVALGNQTQISRAQAVQAKTGSQDLFLIPPASQDPTAMLPLNHHVGRARGPAGWVLTSADSGASCTLQTAPWVNCSGSNLAGTVAVIPTDRTMPAAVAFEIVTTGNEARE